MDDTWMFHKIQTHTIGMAQFNWPNTFECTSVGTDKYICQKKKKRILTQCNTTQTINFILILYTYFFQSVQLKTLCRGHRGFNSCSDWAYNAKLGFFIFFILHELKAHIITSPHVHVAFKPQTGKNCHFGFPTFDPLKFGLKGLFNEKTLTTTWFKLKVC